MTYSTTDIISLIIRVIHIAATCTSLGGLFYARMVLLPSLDTLPQTERDAMLKESIRRFSYIKFGGIAILAITGVVQWFIVYPTIRDQQLYIIYFIIKMIGAIGLFGITLMLALPDPRFESMRNHRAFWAGLNICCALVILIGAALMRSVRL